MVLTYAAISNPSTHLRPIAAYNRFWIHNEVFAMMLDEVQDTTNSIISIRAEGDIAVARMAARDIARQMGFSAVNQARIATATSELARNILQYAGEGIVTIRYVQHSNRCGLELVFMDQGPGIADVGRYLQPGGFVNGKRSIGISASRRLMDEFDISTTQQHGTTITCRKWRR
jgi:serine/threonine-protein kinase RsbT